MKRAASLFSAVNYGSADVHRIDPCQPRHQLTEMLDLLLIGLLAWHVGCAAAAERNLSITAPVKCAISASHTYCSNVQSLLDGHSDQNKAWDAHCGVYIEGYDLGVTPDSPLQQPNITACQASCQAEDDMCAGFTFVHTSSINPNPEGTGSSTGSGDCYLKTAAGASSWKLQQELALQPAGNPPLATHGSSSTGCRTFVTAIKHDRTCLQPEQPEHCNAVKEYLENLSDKKYRTEYKGGKWSLFCNVNLLESDVREYHEDSLLNCMKRCRNQENKNYCKALSFVYGRNNSPESNCFVKSTQDLGKFKLAGGWDGVKHKTIRCVSTVTLIYKRQKVQCFDDAQCTVSFGLALLGALGALVQLLAALKVLEGIRRLATTFWGASSKASDGPSAEPAKASASGSPLLQSPGKSDSVPKAGAGAAPGSEPAAEPFLTNTFKVLDTCCEAAKELTSKLAFQGDLNARP